MKEINCILYSGEEKVAEFKNFTLHKTYNGKLLPLYFYYYSNIIPWLESRAIDSHRTGSRLLKKAIGLKDKSNLNTVLSQHARTLTDTYWVKYIDEDINYSDLTFDFNRDFSSLALYGDYDSFNTIAIGTDKYTHELTTTGGCEKCWIKENDDWYLIKKANKLELFSEIFCYKLAKRFNFNIADYSTTTDGYIKSKNFASKLNFEPMWNIVQNNDDYSTTIEALKKLDPDGSKSLVTDYIKIIYMDTLVGNLDRHTKSYGLLRDRLTGDIISMAPNYNNNLALISGGVPSAVNREDDILIESFIGMLEIYPEYALIVKDMLYLPRFILEALLGQTGIKFDGKGEINPFCEIIEFILSACNQISDYIENIQPCTKSLTFGKDY